MTINLDRLVEWYTSRRGTGTYSMYGSRNFMDGTADCSGSATTALQYAGASKDGYLYSTVTLPDYLSRNGFERIAVNDDWDMRRGDVILWSDGNNMAESAGAGGHVMVAVNNSDEISTDYSHQGYPAVNQYNYNEYYSWNNPKYVEVWRYPSAVQSEPIQQKKGIKMILVHTEDGGYYAVDGTSQRHVGTPAMLAAYQKAGIPVVDMKLADFKKEWNLK